MSVLIGTSGWQYADWKGRFYPKTLSQREWLHYYAERFATVELNSAFYRLPDRDQFQRWAQQVPNGFVIAVKVSRYVTHIRRLRDPSDSVKRLIDVAEGLGPNLGPYLLARSTARAGLFPTQVPSARETPLEAKR